MGKIAPLPNRSRTGQFLESKRGDKSNRTLANNNVAIVQRRCFYHDDDQDDDHDHDLLNLRQQLCQQQSLLVYSWFATSLPAEQGNVLRQRLKNPGLDCRRINMASGVRTRIKQGHTTLRRTVAHAYACIRDHRQLLAAACHNLFKRHGSPTSTYNWNTPNIYIYIYACLLRTIFQLRSYVESHFIMTDER